MGHAGQNPWDLHHAVPSVDETGNTRVAQSGARARGPHRAAIGLEREGAQDNARCTAATTAPLLG